MKKNNFKIIKITNNKNLFNYEKKVIIKELILDLKLGYFDFEKEKPQKVKFNIEVNYEDKKPSDDKDIRSIVNYAKIVRLIKKLIKNKRQSEKHFKKQYMATPLKKQVDVEQICNAVDFFIKNISITGQVLAVDSGQNLNWQTPDIMGGKE